MSGGGWGTRGSCCGVEDVARPRRDTYGAVAATLTGAAADQLISLNGSLVLVNRPAGSLNRRVRHCPSRHRLVARRRSLLSASQVREVDGSSPPAETLHLCEMGDRGARNAEGAW